MAEKRKYTLKARAERRRQTRRRIVAAAVELQEEHGPVSTRITDIARLSGVERVTVYTHFPEKRELFEACSAHWFADHPPPDPTSWSDDPDPQATTRAALETIFDYYERNQRMLGNMLRDAEVNVELRTVVSRDFGSYIADVRAQLVRKWDIPGPRRRVLAAVIGLVLDFHAWRRLNWEGLANADAAALLAAFVECATRGDAGGEILEI